MAHMVQPLLDYDTYMVRCEGYLGSEVGTEVRERTRAARCPLSLSLSIYRSIDPSICLSISIYLSIYLYICLSISTYLSIYLYLSINLSIYPSIYLYIYIYIYINPKT